LELILIHLSGVTKTYGERTVLAGVSMSVKPGERAAIIGENGSGKSTLLRLLAGVERPDDGRITVPDDIGYLGQTLGLPPGHTVQQAVDAALAGLRAMERRMRELESALTDEVMDEYGELLTIYQARGGYEADARVDKAFHGLGLAHVGRERVLSSLSGGEQARLGLACVLAAAPGALLLDEPTNHLDEAALTWLEDRLREHRGTVVVVSHDRVFLERVATVVLEVEDGAVTRFGGGYPRFLSAKAAARARWEQSYAAWCEEVRQVREHAATTAHRVAAGRLMRDNNKMAYDRNAGRVQSSVASRVRNAHERLRRLLDDPVPRPPEPLRFHGTFATGTAPGSAPPRDLGHARQASGHPTARPSADPAHQPPGGPARAVAEADARERKSRSAGAGAHGRVLVELRDLRVGDRLRVGSLTIGAGDRLLVRGHNGAGKSTLLQAVAEHARDNGVRVGYLAQEVTFDPELTVLAAYGHGYADERRQALLGTGLFKPHTLGQKVGELSVGQRRRLALARLLAGEHDLLLLDEPTNHLSPLLAEELEQALGHYRGTLVLASHDRALTRRFRGKEIHLTGGRIC
jgi:macrolide transport system ATP-binding/permease protein